MKKQINIALEVFFIAANLRVAITAMPPLTGMIKSFFKLSTTQIGILTTIPLLCFGFISIVTSQIIKHYGTAFTLRLALAILAIANILRVYVGWGLFIGTFFVGMGITLLNVTLPTLIVERKPEKAPFLNGLYTATINLFSAIIGGIAVPLAQNFGWQLTIQLFSVPAVIAFIGSMFLAPAKTRTAKVAVKVDQDKDQKPIYKRPYIWILAAYMGLQSMVFYTIVAWLPSIMVTHQVSATTAGWMTSIFQISGVPVAFLVPRATESIKRLRATFVTMLGGFFAGIVVLLAGTDSVMLLALASLLLGMSTAAMFTLALSLITTISHSAREASATGGIVQSVGYLLASLGPTVFGAIQNTTNNWVFTLVGLIIVGTLAISFGLWLTYHGRSLFE